MRYTAIFVLLVLSFSVLSQYYSSGSDPARLRWNQIKTPAIRIVFEESLEKEALRLAAFIDSMAPHISGTLKHQPRRVDVLIHNHTVYSNGFVSWAPRRTEFFSTPHQNIGSTDWLEHLAIHEYRHVVQIDKLNQGFTRILSYFTGQQAVGGVLGMYLPMWFLEGDAIIAETALTNSGRGRSFEFNRELKAQLVEKGKFSYDKAYMGSFRDHVPDYYKMGYPLTAMARQTYGAELWEKTIRNSGRNSWMLTPFNRAIRQHTGLNQKRLYNNMFEQLTREWENEIAAQNFTRYDSVSALHTDYLRYTHPQFISDSMVVAELRGPALRSQIVSVNLHTGQTETLVYTGIREAEPISANSNLVAWSELVYHPRWENESWSVIRTHHLETGKTSTITQKTNFFAPALHPLEDRIAVVESTPDYRFFITLIDGKTGEKLKEISTPENYFPLTPSWNLNGENIVCVLLSPGGKAIYTLNPESETWRQITSPGFDEIRHPAQSGDTIWYNAKGAISDEIFSINIQTGQKKQLTSSRFGAMFPAVSKSNQIVYSQYNSRGFSLALYNDNPSKKATTETNSFIDNLIDSIIVQKDTTPTPVPNTEYEVEKYSKWNLFNVHSWAPVYADFDRSEVHTGVSVMSQNLLGTAIFSAGYNADPSQSHEKYHLQMIYRAWFPVLKLGIRAGESQFERSGFYQLDDEIYFIDTDQQINHTRIELGMQVPLNLSRGNYSRFLSPEVTLSWQKQTGISFPMTQYILQANQLIPTGVTKQETRRGYDFYSMEYSLYFQNIRRGASRDVAPRMGQVIQGVYRHSIHGDLDRGNIFGLFSRLYFPGIMQHHAIAIDNNYQIKNNGEESGNGDDFVRYFRYNDVLGYPRGYSSIYNDEMYVMRNTYMLPLWNPDVSMGAFAYIKRLRLNLFYDAAIVNYSLTDAQTGEITKNQRNFSSYGTELHADTHFFRFVLPFSLGYRFGIRSFDNEPFHEFILRTGFNSFLVN
ncbi:TolB family protein [Natronoflexus pectinivorans]|uniref:Tol biopolymer transport system component n=1 Tax=Natronoflexus pectinivorans TaxID=682526 RepID=A0A4R2GM84_9BACT|nr:hypothetical protein [Natronoflexus pectinivorans]TCO09818.1 hypothetical protein EV194_102247 [Natronoflexus pectinivorans]